MTGVEPFAVVLFIFESECSEKTSVPVNSTKLV